MNRLLIGALISIETGLVMAADAASKSPQWYEVVVGIIAIPAAILGLAYSYILIKKTKLESRKTELEIKEKEQALNDIGEVESAQARAIIEPIVSDKIWKLLLLRFALLYVTLKLWDLISSVFTFLMGGMFLGAKQVTDNMKVDENWIVWPFYLLSNLPQIVTWLIVLGIGWPLFKDLNTYLQIDIKSLLMPWRKDKSSD